MNVWSQVALVQWGRSTTCYYGQSLRSRLLEGLDDAGAQLYMRKETAYKMWPWLCGVKGPSFLVQEMPEIRKRTASPCLGRIWPDERMAMQNNQKRR